MLIHRPHLRCVKLFRIPTNALFLPCSAVIGIKFFATEGDDLMCEICWATVHTYVLRTYSYIPCVYQDAPCTCRRQKVLVPSRSVRTIVGEVLRTEPPKNNDAMHTDENFINATSMKKNDDNAIVILCCHL